MCGYFCTFNIRQGNKEVCFHFNSQSSSQAVIIFDANYLKEQTEALFLLIF